MPDEVKKKRGRPPKNKEKINVNESVSQIKMREEPQESITVSQVNSRLNNIFTRMSAAGLSYSNFKNALNRSPFGDGLFTSNPFI